MATHDPDTILTGILHVYVAFDWGEEIDLEKARVLVPAEVRDLPRRRRTPVSIGYRPQPLRFVVAPPPFELPEAGPVPSVAEATVFDFAAVSMALHVPFQLSRAALSRLSGHLIDSTPWVRSARAALESLHER